MRRPSLKILKFPNEATSSARGGASREAIVEAAERLFLERGFGAVSMDARQRVGSARECVAARHRDPRRREDVVRLIARAILDLHGRPRYLGFLRMVAADSRRFPWIGEAFAAIPVGHRRRGSPLAGFTLAGHQSLGWSLPSERWDAAHR